MLGVHHPLVKSIRKAVQRGARTEDGFAVAEGFHLLEEAIAANLRIAAILATPTAAARLPDNIPPVHLVEESTLHQISSVETSQGVLSLVAVEEHPLGALFHRAPLVIALDGIQDPGNAGTIIRSAEAFGSTGAVFLKGSVSPWNPKTLRASAGSLFRLPFALAEWEEFHREMQKRQIALYSAHPRAKSRIDQVPLHGACAILIGSEGRGVPPDHERHAIGVRIPTTGVESLNAALAAGILLYEARRQRS
ncbi:MAG: RNA methyltransferase [Acidobacteria bacterium]|nr:RNA methyltransferase [Acidobacteriota bacterium]